jgi:hypothetical protein
MVEIRSIRAGERIFLEGDAADWLAFVIEGKFSITKQGGSSTADHSVQGISKSHPWRDCRDGWGTALRNLQERIRCQVGDWWTALTE